MHYIIESAFDLFSHSMFLFEEHSPLTFKAIIGEEDSPLSAGLCSVCHVVLACFLSLAVTTFSQCFSH